MVQTANITEDELEQVNQFLFTLENIVNEKRQWEIETIIEGEGLEGVIQAFLSMIIANFDQSIAKFRVYPRFVKKLEDGRIRIHSSTRISPTETMDITWTLTHPKGEFQKLVIETINSMTVPIYEESRGKRTEIPRLDENWKSFMRTIERVKRINKIYMKIKKEEGKTKAKDFFNDKEEFEEEIDNLFGFLEGSFKIIAYIAVLGVNVEGWKGVILQKNGEYEVVLDGFRDLEALESLTTIEKMTEKEYIELLKFIWKERTKKANLKIEIEIQKEKRRLIYKVKKKPVTTKGRKKLVKGERTVKQ